MPELTAEQLKQAFKNEPDKTAHTLGVSLRDFGYSSCADTWVKSEMERLIKGEQPRGGPSMFLSRWLKEGID